MARTKSHAGQAAPIKNVCTTSDCAFNPYHITQKGKVGGATTYMAVSNNVKNITIVNNALPKQSC